MNIIGQSLLIIVLTLLPMLSATAQDCLSRMNSGRFVIHCAELQSSVELDGQWLVVEGKLLAPESIDKATLKAAEPKYLPGRFQSKGLFETQVGIATLIADVEFPAAISGLEMSPGWVNSSHRIFVRDGNGRFVKVFENANLEELADDEAGRLRLLPVLLPNLGQKTRIVIHIHNGPYLMGGVSEIVSLSPQGVLIREHEVRQSLHMLFVGIFMTVAFYNIYLWFHFRLRWDGLLLGLLAIGFAVRNFAIGGMLDLVSPSGTTVLYHYFGWYTYLVNTFLWPIYFALLFRREFKLWMLVGCSAPVGVLLLYGLFAPLSDFIYWGMEARKLTMVIMLLMVYTATVAAYRRHGDGLITLLGVILMIASGLLDLSYYARGISPTIEYSNAGYLAFLILQTTVISRAYFESMRHRTKTASPTHG